MFITGYCCGADTRITRPSKPHGNSGGSHRSRGEGHTQQSVIIEGLDSGTVVGIAFAAFAIGILLTGALWFIHTHTGNCSLFCGGFFVSFLGEFSLKMDYVFLLE